MDTGYNGGSVQLKLRLVTHGHFGHDQTVDVHPDLSRVARTLGDPTRIRILLLLMEGRALTAKELAYGAGVEPATGTSHLQRLLADALVVCAAEGRHKYFRLASPQVAQCVEALMVIAVPARAAAAKPVPPLHSARLCYDHLAGRLGTEITHALLERQLVHQEDRTMVVSKKGVRWFTQFGVDVDALALSRRKFAYACLDWSERKDHLAGALGAALAQRMMDAGWIKRNPGTRIVSVTKSGRDALASTFGIQWE